MKASENVLNIFNRNRRTPFFQMKSLSAFLFIKGVLIKSSNGNFQCIEQLFHDTH